MVGYTICKFLLCCYEGTRGYYLCRRRSYSLKVRVVEYTWPKYVWLPNWLWSPGQRNTIWSSKNIGECYDLTTSATSNLFGEYDDNDFFCFCLSYVSISPFLSLSLSPSPLPPSWLTLHHRVHLNTRRRATCCSPSTTKRCCTTASCRAASPSPITPALPTPSSAWSPPPRTTPPSSCTHPMRSCCRYTQAETKKRVQAGSVWFSVCRGASALDAAQWGAVRATPGFV